MMELDMERARAAEKRGDMDAFQKAEDSVKNRNADIDKLKTSGIFALQNVHTSGAYQLQSTGMTTSSQEKIAKLNREAQAAIASANSPLALYTALGDAKPESSLRKGFDLQTLKAHAASLQETWSRQAYPNGNMGEPNMTFLARYPDPKTYINENLQAMGSGTGGGFVQPPANATILPAKK
jgi:hypothetical protein